MAGRKAYIVCVYVVYICGTESAAVQTKPLIHATPPIICRLYYYTTTVEEPVNLWTLQSCGQGESSHILSGKKAKWESPMVVISREIPLKWGLNQTIPTGSTSIVQPRGKVNRDNIRVESGPRRKSCQRYRLLVRKAKAGTGPITLKSIMPSLALSSRIRRYTLSASRRHNSSSVWL